MTTGSVIIISRLSDDTREHAVPNGAAGAAPDPSPPVAPAWAVDSSLPHAAVVNKTTTNAGTRAQRL
ncbi:MAG TPA: hypothetical protein VFM81_05515 [Actinomycetota bacterium]|nr:hypothetical protein [Actinomycetota bacterium]